ncbi:MULTISPECIES: polysaccharide deacetylase family protein [Caproicibacterium]|jgi:peptidoglycan/xylan/chitin deacetylase (PgdA/CDA1 family)|uniref:Polysaccharide deacetylase family protein n=1 Tax=Caproicibacterium lactatifermentans TaxID=2666138 RepID=A0A859DPI0_9FIRM|nr:polysaccharide deacetylase family protein [Caproicibacterium lactatifermentans]ARP50541.1 hypothetical protein B6259_06415 [Ruminococcaceae bacterium CPB6]MDD4807828.1 polysaccharide deacetylase family protein [Oscillospiraceae bacterium]QKN23738.1 polysaccharide deacetylase family protein [Caproicibacterium lactatifermentans]QKO29627.1 polysaccharide deacetylase family protein [Caproicibacterium lactatifermentans]
MNFIRYRIHRAATTLVAVAVVLAAAGCLHTSGTVQTSAVPTKLTASGVQLPILMYHSMLPPSVLRGKYIVSPSLFEKDLQYLQKEKYTTVTMQNLLDYVHGKGDLPQKPIIISFDDGYYNNYKYAYPLLKKYHMKMIFSPIGICTEQYSKGDSDHWTYSHVTWKELDEMLKSGTTEVQNHTYNLHHDRKSGRLGVSKRRSESVADYQKMLRGDLSYMQDLMYQHTGVHMNTFVYPFGAMSEATGDVIRSLGFQATMTCTEHINVITRDPECLYGLGRYLRPPDITPEQFFAKKILPAGQKLK